MDPVNKSNPEIIEGEKVSENHSQTPQRSLNKDSDYLIKAHEEASRRKRDQGFASGIASELAAWYERLRTAIENRDEEVILRAAVERILRRRLLLGGNGKTVGPLLVRELIWARYFPDESISDDKIFEVEQSTDFRDAFIKFMELQDFKTGIYCVAKDDRKRKFESDDTREETFTPSAKVQTSLCK